MKRKSLPGGKEGGGPIKEHSYEGRSGLFLRGRESQAFQGEGRFLPFSLAKKGGGVSLFPEKRSWGESSFPIEKGKKNSPPAPQEKEKKGPGK